MVCFFRSLRFRLILLAMAALLPTMGAILYYDQEHAGRPRWWTD
jgi:hypothetical protein